LLRSAFPVEVLVVGILSSRVSKPPGTRPEPLLAPRLRRAGRRAECRGRVILDLCPAFGALPRIGNEGMICPAKAFSAAISAAINDCRFDVFPAAWPFTGMSPKFMRHHPSPDRSFMTRLAPHRGAHILEFSLCGSPIGGTCCRQGLHLFHLSFHPMRDAALYRPRLASTSDSRILAGGASFPRVAPKRVSHGQQNAYRCVSPRRNQGGRPSR
jgi:hypothetical protein